MIQPSLNGRVEQAGEDEDLRKCEKCSKKLRRGQPGQACNGCGNWWYKSYMGLKRWHIERGESWMCSDTCATWESDERVYVEGREGETEEKGNRKVDEIPVQMHLLAKRCWSYYLKIFKKYLVI